MNFASAFVITLGALVVVRTIRDALGSRRDSSISPYYVAVNALLKRCR